MLGRILVVAGLLTVGLLAWSGAGEVHIAEPAAAAPCYALVDPTSGEVILVSCPPCARQPHPCE